jgi:hypothetical protein
MVKETHIYDLVNWRPVTPEKYLEELGMASMTLSEPSELKVEIEDMDGYVRLVLWAEIKIDEGANAEVAPYLMMLYSAEGGSKPRCFLRQVHLAIA